MDLCVNPRLFLTSALRWGAGIWGEDEEGEGSSACLGLIHIPSLSLVFVILSVICWFQRLLAQLSL